MKQLCLCLQRKMTHKLSPAEISRIKAILNEDDVRFAHQLSLLQHWIDCHTFIPRNYEKNMLEIFLRNCKYNLEKAKIKIELYFIYKKKYPQMFAYHNFNERELMALANIYMGESYNLTPEGYRVGYLALRSSNVKGCDPNALTKLLLMLGTLRSNVYEMFNGFIIVINLQNFSPVMASWVTNPSFKRFFQLLQTVYPFRVRGMFFISAPAIAVPTVNIVKMLVKEKIRNLIHVESGDECMRRHIPAECLPKEWGGTDDTISGSYKYYLQMFQSAETWFLAHEKVNIVANIPKELHIQGGIDDDLGVQGSFRKLSID